MNIDNNAMKLIQLIAATQNSSSRKVLHTLRIWPTIRSKADAQLADADWRQQVGALRALGAIGEGLTTQLRGELRRLVPLVCVMIRSADHCRVRHAACALVIDWSSDLAPSLQDSFTRDLLGALLDAIEKDPVVRVRFEALNAIGALVNDVFYDTRGMQWQSPQVTVEATVTRFRGVLAGLVEQVRLILGSAIDSLNAN